MRALIIAAFAAAVVVPWADARALELAACREIPRVDLARLRGLHGTALNRHINAGYARFAECFQGLAEGNADVSRLGSAPPVWYAFAPYASRVVGASEAAMEDVLAGASKLAGGAGALLGGHGLEAIRGLLSSLLGAVSIGGKGADLAVLLSPGVLVSTSTCLLGVLAAAPHRSLWRLVAQKATAVVKTLLALLEDGNRRIYSDVGAAGEAYLRWRAGRARVEAADVVTSFARRFGASPEKVRALRSYARSQLGASQHSTAFDALPGGAPACKDALTVAFALYEEGGAERSTVRRERYIAFANDLIAWCEQHDVVQPAFDPGATLPGEVSRPSLMRCLTPTTWLTFRKTTWTVADYAKRAGLPLTQLNWARFSDRWPAILDAFRALYATPRAPWPMPAADPTKGP